MRPLLLVCAGGALGSGARHLVGLWTAGAAFPAGTLAVNLAGSFLIAVVLGVALRVTAFPADVRVLLAPGLMGGFTTYSAFTLDVVRLLEAGTPWRAGAYLAATVVGCLAAGVLGGQAAGLAVRARAHPAG